MKFDDQTTKLNEVIAKKADFEQKNSDLTNKVEKLGV